MLIDFKDKNVGPMADGELGFDKRLLEYNSVELSQGRTVAVPFHVLTVRDIRAGGQGRVI